MEKLSEETVNAKSSKMSKDFYDRKEGLRDDAPHMQTLSIQCTNR